nr:mucin-5AC-like [Dermatophagoides farinae]
MSFLSNQNNVMTPTDASLTSPSSTNTLSSSPTASITSSSSSSTCSVSIVKQEELVENLIRGCTGNTNLNTINTNTQSTPSGQIDQCTSAAMGTNIVSDQQLQYLNHQALLNQTSINGNGNNGNGNVHFTQSSLTQQPENISPSLQSILQPATDLTNTGNVSMQVVTQVPITHSIQQQSTASAFVPSIDHPMTNIKNENDSNLSPPQLTPNPVSATTTSIKESPLPEISLQDLNKQLNAIAIPVVRPVQMNTVPQTATQTNIATNMTMAMEGVLDGSYPSNKITNETTANQLPPLLINTNHTSMLTETNANPGNGSVTIINQQQSIVGTDSTGLLNQASNPLSNGLGLSSSDFQMLNLQTTQTTSNDFMVSATNNNPPMMDTIMSTLNQANSNTANVTVTTTNPTTTIDSFMQTLPVSNADNLATLGNPSQPNQPKITEQLPCSMMTNDCPPLIQTSSTMTISEPLVATSNQLTAVNQQALNVLEQQVANQNHQLQQEILDSLNQMNNTGAVNGNQLQNIAMAVDPTPSSSSSNSTIVTNQTSPPQVGILGSGKLASYCHQENKVDLTSINQTNSLSQEMNSAATTNQQQVFMRTMSTNLVQETHKQNELMLPAPTSMITNQNQPPMASLSTVTSTNNSNNNNGTVLTTTEPNDLTSAQSNICPMSKMSDAELIVFIDPAAFD